MLFLFFSPYVSSQIIIGYWGQDGSGIEQNLAYYCGANQPYNIIIISYLNVFFDVTDPNNYPTLNFANHCGTTFTGHLNLLHCNQIGLDIKFCQSKGKKIL